ncbi:hypothetical protein [Nocardia ignorata]|uniref:Uncharacterized protein n=1 Tax=Nocardia ignorata TaxID=145285 RepID=A0A4R6NYF5_NOCIG|nr:hypothetical protein [Nocardia ignorata]TDP29790.1 hypothetical protein DFR75_11258 [Nocardia ignorata]
MPTDPRLAELLASGDPFADIDILVDRDPLAVRDLLEAAVSELLTRDRSDRG